MVLLLDFSDKQITPWGGMALVKRMLDHIDWAGANRFEHLELTRFDAVLGKISGYESMANYKALTQGTDPVTGQV